MEVPNHSVNFQVLNIDYMLFYTLQDDIVLYSPLSIKYILWQLSVQPGLIFCWIQSTKEGAAHLFHIMYQKY